MGLEIRIVDTGIGNITSIHKALLEAGACANRATTAAEIEGAEKLVLPGVGHFKAAKERLKALGLYDALDEAVRVQKKPIFGICLGMQLMCVRSDEGNEKGFGWIDAEVVKFRMGGLGMRKVPHICWNTFDVLQKGRLLSSVVSGSEAWFAHSYHIDSVPKPDILATTTYGYVFPSVIEHGNIYGTQFHPEKSGRAGLAILKSFLAT